MGRKALLENLKKNAKEHDDKIQDLLDQLEKARTKQAAAWNKYHEREKEIEQENNNALAEISKNLFWADISAEELQSKWDELLLISEVKEYIEFEKTNHEAEIKRKAAEKAAKKKAESQTDGNVINNNDANNTNVSDAETINTDVPYNTNDNIENN